ncbi:hypothetical protein IWQ61_002020 [Dispira simplex]|nr:hypothetical protein IWQ61_002020 [Dispira simplex]
MAYASTAHSVSPTFYYDRTEKSKAHLHSAREPIHVRRHEYYTESSSPELTPSRSPNGNNFTPLRTTVICNVCGKKYKHRSCLIKHRWEHHESWESCLKYNLTKHQQVQMMEAAQILVEMIKPEV